MVRFGLVDCDWLEIAVVLFQVCGVAALCVNRLVISGKWPERSRVGFVVALVGLGIAGALCGRQDSEFALFAGGTMTLLLIGMTIGGGSAHTTHRNTVLITADGTSAA
jgi:hypothetical protein